MAMEKPSLVHHHHHLHTRVLAIRRTWVNRIFALVYSCAIFALLYHHLFHYFSILIVVADVVLAFMWATRQSFRMFPIRREVFPENLAQIAKDESNYGELYPDMDVFICTADPYKEPPMCAVNTALSVMAYDYPAAKLSVYVSDDGGSQLTLFALMEAAKFAAHWLPYCRNTNIVDRCPEAYFESQPAVCSPQNDKIKLLYESMKIRVENVVDRGSVNGSDYNITDEHEVSVFSKWMDGFTSQDHPSIIQVLLDSGANRDAAGHEMPNLIYVSREKRKATSHHFKAGALNVLVRVSATMTNAPIILTIDCDMYSNDPKTPLRALCYFLDPCADSRLAYVQFPQRFRGINRTDIYSAEFKGWTEIDAAGFDGILGPNYMGTGCFFNRRALFGGPSSIVLPKDDQELRPHHVVNKPIQDNDVLTLAHHVAGCCYEDQTQWGCEMGFKYGSLVEDFYTGFRLHCKGWKSIFCNPDRPAFLGNAPTTLHDLLMQTKRWSIGLLEMAFCKYSPLTFGIRSMNIFQALGYTHYSFWPIWSIPITIYAFFPQTALINFSPVFPKVSDPWFLLYAFLFIGAYVQDFLDFTLAGGTVPKWWSSQRMWMMRGISSFPLASLEFILGCFGLYSGFGFSVTSKVVENEQNQQRYDKGIFEFGVPSPMFFPIAMAAIMNLIAFSYGIIQIFRDVIISYKDMFVQMFIAGFVVVNSWPIYEAMILRTDKGKMPVKVTLISAALAWALYLAFSLAI